MGPKTVNDKVQQDIMKTYRGKVVRVILMNGFQMEVTLCEEDETCITVADGKGKKMIYKHAISTIEF